jgi:pimeloyl-ACP methyl ester carboxylesterase
MKIYNKLMLLGLFAVSPFTFGATGIAFVHGTGHQTNALADYWTAEFVNSVRQGIPQSANYTVINCNFDQYMWEESAAGCLATQLTSFIQAKKIDKLILLTHSNGGNVVRWLLSNPTWDSRYPAVIAATSRVIALAPSSGGTPLADAVNQGNVFETTLGWLLGYGSNAVKQQQVSNMSYYNANWLNGTAGRPSLGKPFEVVVGSDVDSAFWDSDSYCAGYQYQVALETTQNWLDSCSDGFLNCSSQKAAGTVWFTDIQKTRGQEPLSHQQSRRACFNLDTLIRNHL